VHEQGAHGAAHDGGQQQGEQLEANRVSDVHKLRAIALSADGLRPELVGVSAIVRERPSWAPPTAAVRPVEGAALSPARQGRKDPHRKHSQDDDNHVQHGCTIARGEDRGRTLRRELAGTRRIDRAISLSDPVHQIDGSGKW
jgi:hypothetical protein